MPRRRWRCGVQVDKEEAKRRLSTFVMPAPAAESGIENGPLSTHSDVAEWSIHSLLSSSGGCPNERQALEVNTNITYGTS